MMRAPNTAKDNRAIELAIIAAWWHLGSAAHIATAFSTCTRKLHASDIERIWAKAKEKGDLPNLNRPSVKTRRGHADAATEEKRAL